MRRDESWLIYGATGYTGRLVAAEAVRRGLRPVLCGRDPEAVAALAGELDLPWRAFALDDRAGLDAALSEVRLVLHCAGPFVRTSRPMTEACLRSRCHYLDITGEIAVFEAILARDREARDDGVVLLPGVGFDVVPSDCLAAALAAALPGARSLDLAFASERGGWSAGTVKTMIESLPAAGAVRRGGRIVPVPPAAATIEVAFPFGVRTCVSIPWGDVSTAFHTTGIPDVRTFATMPRKAIRTLRLSRPLLPLLGVPIVKRALQRWAGRKVVGPDEATRRTVRTHLWGRVTDGSARAFVGALETPEGYALTAVSAVESAVRVLAGTVVPGAWTPAKAFGAGFATSLPGVSPIVVQPG